MSTQSEHAAENGIGELPDLVGAVIPGASRLSPRHPVKVTAIMLLLGIISGWVSAFGGLAGVMIGFSDDYAFQVCATSGFAFGLVVLIPWCRWSDRSGWWALLLIPTSFVVNFVCFWIVFDQFSEVGILIVMLPGAVWGFSLGALGMYLQRRWSVIGLFTLALGMGLCFVAGLAVMESGIVEQALSSLPIGQLNEVVMLAWLFSACHASLAMGLGCLLWDQRVKISCIPREDAS